MMKTLFKIMLISIGILSQSNAMAEEIALGRAAELACHRIERLVTLRKIEESFLNNFNLLKIELLTQENPEAPRFKVSGYQFTNSSENSKAIILNLNTEGRALNYSLVDGVSESGPTWTTKDPVTLMENALHFVIENGDLNNDISPYLNKLAEVRLFQEISEGKQLAKIEMKNAVDKQILTVWLSLEGEFIRYEISL